MPLNIAFWESLGIVKLPALPAVSVYVGVSVTFTFDLAVNPCANFWPSNVLALEYAQLTASGTAE